MSNDSINQPKGNVAITGNVISANTGVFSTNTKTNSNSVTNSGTPQKTITQGENQMADVDSTSLALGQAAIRHDIGLAEANIRGQVGQEACLINKNIGDTGQRLEKGLGDNRYTIATEAAALSKQIGAEICATNKNIGDTRQEDAENFGHTRRDIQATTADIRREVAKEACDTIATVKDARHDIITATGSDADRVVDRISEHDIKVADRFFAVGRDLADLRQGQITIQKDIELNALKTQIEGQKNTQYLSDKITLDGEKTRGLINDLKYHDLNRGLVERNTALVECESDRRHWRHNAEQNQFQGQWAQLQSQIQAFQSQLQETRQGMVNFGTMAGVGQSSTSNNVR